MYVCAASKPLVAGLFLFLALAPSISPASFAQAPANPPPSDIEPDEFDEPDAPTKAPQQVSVEPGAQDTDIAERLTSILEATEWFDSPQVRVDQGVVFLSGEAQREEQKVWAGNLARNTQDVVAVVNRIAVAAPSVFDLSPARAELNRLVRESIELLPLLAIMLVLLFATWWVARLAHWFGRTYATRQLQSPLLRQVIARALTIPVALLGIYLALRISGLSRLAFTVLGGTGIIGLVVGIAFRDIAENYLASILISMKRPFNVGDVIRIVDQEGIVQSVTTRGTTLMTWEGNHIQIPNSIVYKSVIYNFTANPNMRLDFIVGIDYADSIADAQQTILDTMRAHDAVLADPEPLVLVVELATSTVNLKPLFWVNIEQHSQFKVRSAVIRLVKQTLDQAGFTLPDESREVIFPQGVPVSMVEESKAASDSNGELRSKSPRGSLAADQPTDTPAEGDLRSERNDVQRQADAARNPEGDENLLETA